MDGHDHNHDMPGMSPPSATMDGGGTHGKMTMMHMTFFWGKNAEILFSGWPGTRGGGMYALALIFIFVLAILVEWLSHSKLIKPGTGNVVAGLVQTLLHGTRVGLAYLVMLAVMSFNAGIFLAAVAGHTLGFLLFASRVFKGTVTEPTYQKSSDIPHTNC